ncbi:MAG: ABC transporter ATP-binding protein [Flavobacteriales bacterium]
MIEDSVIQIDQLGIAFQRNGELSQAVYDSTFHVSRGKTLAIVGESGSGKSVSSLSIMGLLHPEKTIFTSGSFLFHPSIVSDAKRDNIAPNDPMLKRLRGKEIAMIFQEPMTSLNPVMTCGRQVEEVLVKHLALSRDEARIKTLNLFNEVRLPRAELMLDQYPHQLSGGQRQRVMIAMAIACEPKLLIADEPTTALDVTVQKEILNLLRQLQQERQMAMIFITHDLGVVEEIADDILVMKKGHVVEYGGAQAILSNPQHEYTRGLLKCRPEPGKKDQRLLTVRDFEVDSDPIAIHKKERAIVDDVFLNVADLSKQYESRTLLRNKTNSITAVDRVSFTIRKGETMGLVGESGCGKTTLSRMLLGLIPATSGSIEYTFGTVGATDITALSASQLRSMRKEIQIVFQDPYSALNPKHTIGAALTEPMLVHGLGSSASDRKKRAIELLEKVGLADEHFYRYPHEFSGGQRQRIVIARALACEPSFIICDESVSALDVSVQAQVLNLLNDLKYEFGLTYLFISHDLRVVHYMSDRIMVMNKGRIEELGTANDVFFNPRSHYTQTLLSAIPGGNN